MAIAMAGLAIFRRITNGQFRIAIGILLGVSGVALLARTW